MAKEQLDNPPHHMISAVVALVAVIALVVVFQSNGPTANVVEMSGNPAEEVGGWKISNYFNAPSESELQAHPLYCRHFPGDNDYMECCPEGRSDKTCTDPCPRSKAADPSDLDLTGNCCFQLNRGARCETWGDVRNEQSKYSAYYYESPTQPGVTMR